MFLVDCATQNSFALSCIIQPPKDKLRAKMERVTELALNLMKINAIDRLSLIDSRTVGGHHKQIIEKVRSFVEVCITWLFQFYIITFIYKRN